MRARLIALHGYTMRGASLRDQMQALDEALAARVEIRYPDAPFLCDDASVDRLYAVWGRARSDGPHRTWWDASDDGRVYAGWERSVALVAEHLSQEHDTVLLGFSQGAMLAAVVAALSARGELPPIRAVVLVAGRVPRAEVLQPLLAAPLDVPSLHVWGERDLLARESAPALYHRFRGARRVVWPGSHVIPTRGPASAEILSFIGESIR